VKKFTFLSTAPVQRPGVGLPASACLRRRSREHFHFTALRTDGCRCPLLHIRLDEVLRLCICTAWTSASPLRGWCHLQRKGGGRSHLQRLFLTKKTSALRCPPLRLDFVLAVQRSGHLHPSVRNAVKWKCSRLRRRRQAMLSTTSTWISATRTVL
jgi:hypothetical protein